MFWRLFGDVSESWFEVFFLRIFWDSFGSRSSFKRASRSIAKTGSFCVFVLSVFFSSVSGGSFFSFFEFSVGFGGPKGGHFWTFFVKQTVFS